jgi:hypothetical protein
MGERLTREQLLKEVPIGERTLAYYIQTKAIPFLRISPRKVLFDRDSIEEWLKKKEVKECTHD